MSRSNPGVVDFPNVISKFLMFGMSLSQVIACATVNAARVFPAYDDRGTLNVGAPADVALLELRQGTFDVNNSGARGQNSATPSPPRLHHELASHHTRETDCVPDDTNGSLSERSTPKRD